MRICLSIIIYVSDLGHVRGTPLGPFRSNRATYSLKWTYNDLQDFRKRPKELAHLPSKCCLLEMLAMVAFLVCLCVFDGFLIASRAFANGPGGSGLLCRGNYRDFLKLRKSSFGILFLIAIWTCLLLVFS